MKHQDLVKYHQLTPADLTQEIHKLELSFTDIKLKTTLGQLKNTSSSKNTRRDIARLKTILKSKQLNAQVLKAKKE